MSTSLVIWSFFGTVLSTLVYFVGFGLRKAEDWTKYRETRRERVVFFASTSAILGAIAGGAANYLLTPVLTCHETGASIASCLARLSL